MDELIRKQDVLELPRNKERNFRGEVVEETIDVELIKALPPVQPKRGKWVFKTVFPNDTSEFPMGYLVCSECGSKHSNKTPCNFCDNCGADMRTKEADCDYERAVEQLEHDMLYEPTFDPDDGSM